MKSRDEIRLNNQPAPAGSAAPAPSASDLDHVDLPSTVISMRQRIKSSLALPVIVVIILITLGGAMVNTQFFQHSIWTLILESCSTAIIVACFEGLIMISGGIDLSVGSTYLAGAMMGASVVYHGHSDLLAILAALGVGLGIGLVNGLLVNYVGISPIIATLGTLFVVEAAVQDISQGNPIGPLPERFTALGQTIWHTVPLLVIIALVFAALVHGMLEHTVIGPRIRAIGGNREAARALGLNPKIASTVLYVLMGAVAAFAGVLEAANLGAGDPTLGTNLELTVIAAVIIGGTSVYGAVGSIPGVVFGSILLALLVVGLVLMHWSGALNDLVLGAVLILAASIAQLRHARTFRMSIKEVENDD
jgi:ribose/xylose/arabinose/galactoside ABC-type transport system permease subunit